MRKVIVISILLIVTGSLWAQSMHDPKAKVILDKVSAKAQESQPFEIEFTNRLIDKQSDVDETTTGTVKVSGAKYLLTLGSTVLYCDGKTVWTYYPEMEEVELRKIEDMDDAMNPVRVFDMYKEGFKYRLKGSKVISGKNYYVIDLYPEDTKSKKYSRAQLLVNKSNKELYSFSTYFKDGKEYQLTLKTFQSNISVKNSDFVFDTNKYPNVEVTDLRDE